MSLGPRWLRRRAKALRERAVAHPRWRARPARRLKDLGTPRRPRSVALTFDDGPDPDITPRFRELLAEHRAQATFFMCGLAAQRHLDIVRAAAAAGHTIGGHTWDHRDIRLLSGETSWQRQIDATHALLEHLAGRPVRYFRPPWGARDAASLRQIERRRLVPVVWSIHGSDWEEQDPEAIARQVATGLVDGAIVLLHDGCGDLLRPDAAAASWLSHGPHDHAERAGADSRPAPRLRSGPGRAARARRAAAALPPGAARCRRLTARARRRRSGPTVPGTPRADRARWSRRPLPARLRPFASRSKNRIWRVLGLYNLV